LRTLRGPFLRHTKLIRTSLTYFPGLLMAESFSSPTFGIDLNTFQKTRNTPHQEPLRHFGSLAQTNYSITDLIDQ
jgi:hypothetical protein